MTFDNLGCITPADPNMTKTLVFYQSINMFIAYLNHDNDNITQNKINMYTTGECLISHSNFDNG